METFLAFFDVLGFKEFIYNTELAGVKQEFDNLLRDTQTALSGATFKQAGGAIVPDLSQQTINCLHVSDSIVFWTADGTETAFLQLVDVCYDFYWRSLQTSFPLRGCLTFGEIEFSPFTINNSQTGAAFHNFSLIGRGLVDAYTRAEAMNYAGCFVHMDAINKVRDQTVNNLIYAHKLCYYKVLFKTKSSYEHVFRPNKGTHNEVSFRNAGQRIKQLFSAHMNSKPLPESVQEKLNNTIDFLGHFRETQEFVDKSEK